MFPFSGVVVFGGCPWERTGVNKVGVRQTPTIMSIPGSLRQEKSVWLEVDDHDVELVASYNISGREVARLHVEGVTGAGSLFHWNGRDAPGASTPGGVYCIVEKTGAGILKGKIVRQ